MIKFLSNNKERAYNALLFGIIFLIEIFIALFIRDNFIRPFVGDVLVVLLIYFFIKIFFLKRIKLLPLYIFIFASGIEILQLIDIVGILGLYDNVFLRTVIGTVFDVKDIVCYGVGCFFIATYEYVKHRDFKKRLAKGSWSIL